MADDYYIARGTLSSSLLLADSSNRVTNFPKQTDQRAGWYWLIATDDVIHPYQERVLSATSRYGGQGSPWTVWRWAILTMDMWEWINENIFNYDETADVTIQTKDRVKAFRGSDWLVLTARAHRPRLDQVEFGLHGGIYQTNVPMPLTRLTLAEGVGAFSDGFSDGFAT